MRGGGWRGTRRLPAAAVATDPAATAALGVGLQGGSGRRSARAGEIEQQVAQVAGRGARGFGGLCRRFTCVVLVLGWLLLLIVRCGRLVLRLAARF